MFISPMLLQTKESAFNDYNYLFELKNNGVRLLYDSYSKGIN